MKKIVKNNLLFYVLAVIGAYMIVTVVKNRSEEEVRNLKETETEEPKNQGTNSDHPTVPSREETEPETTHGGGSFGAESPQPAPAPTVTTTPYTK